MWYLADTSLISCIESLASKLDHCYSGGFKPLVLPEVTRGSSPLLCVIVHFHRSFDTIKLQTFWWHLLQIVLILGSGMLPPPPPVINSDACSGNNWIQSVKKNKRLLDCFLWDKLNEVSMNFDENAIGCILCASKSSSRKIWQFLGNWCRGKTNDIQIKDRIPFSQSGVN